MEGPGFVLLVTGIVYLIKPDIFQRGIWLRTSIAQRTLTPEQYALYMRGLGAVSVVVGLYLLSQKPH